MKMKALFAAAAIAALGTGVSAQGIPGQVIGQTGAADYPHLVLGNNGVTYECRQGTVTEYFCRRSGGAAVRGGNLGGLGTGGALALAGAAIAIILIAANDSTDGTT